MDAERLVLPVSVLAVTGSVIQKVAGGLLEISREANGIRLRVGDFSHQLAADTPVLQTSPTSYVLPGSSDNSKQLVLSFGRGCAAAALAQFERLLSGVAQVRRGLSDTRADALPFQSAAAGVAPPATPSASPVESVSSAADAPTDASTAATVGTYVATGVVFAGKALSQGLVVGAEYGGAGLRWAAEKVKPYVASGAAPTGSDDAAAAPSPTGRPPQLAVSSDSAASAGPRSSASATTSRVSGTGTAAVAVSARGAGTSAPVEEWGGAASAVASSSGRAEGGAQAAASPGLDKWKTVLTVAKWASSAAVTGSRAVAAGVTAAAGSLGSSLASAISTTEYGRSWAESECTDTGRAVRQVAAASLVAYRDIMDGLERAAAVFADQAGPATTDLVKARYGEEAAAVAQQGLSVAADVGTAAWNIRNAGVRGLVRAAATEAGKELVVGSGAAATIAASSPAALSASTAASPVNGATVAATPAAAVGGRTTAQAAAAPAALASASTLPRKPSGTASAATSAASQPASATATGGDASLEALLASMPAPPTAVPGPVSSAATGTQRSSAPSSAGAARL